MSRAAVDTDTLIKVVLVLVVLWLALEIAEQFLDLALELVGPLRPVLGAVVLLLLVLYLLD